MRIRQAFAAAWLLAAAGCGLGCGSVEAPAEVSGTVLVDGQPLNDGEITFVAADNAKAPAAGPVVNGKYAVAVTPGPKKVKIQASRAGGKGDGAMGSGAREARLGPEFNEKSKLTADIKPGKNEGVDFQVKELPKK